jgi:hypothetical protein
MAVADTMQEIAAAQGAALTVTLACGEAPARVGRVPLRDTLHCNSGAPGSAAQFNPSVSAMPRYAPWQIGDSSRGTADTLSKR